MERHEEIEKRLIEGRPLRTCDMRWLLAENARLRKRCDAAVKMLDGIENCLICTPGGAGCSAYGDKS